MQFGGMGYPKPGSLYLEFIDASGGVMAIVYYGCTACFDHVSVLASFPDGVGDTICTDGSVNLENCSVDIQQVDLCVQYQDGQTVCHLDLATSTNGVWAVQRGDSGGPVYVRGGSPDGVDALGTISGETGTGQGSNSVLFTPFQRDLLNTFRLICTGVCN
jgi:hypothetical protein